MLVSIFNDVIGPVMRGPSSSHCAAALRIGRLARDLMHGEIQEVLVEFDRNGALPTTHESQGSDMGLFGGLMGWDAADERLPNSGDALRDAGTQVRIETVDVRDPHSNTYRLTLTNARERHTLRAISTGGGMMEVIDIDGFAVSLFGDYFETLFRATGAAQTLIERLREGTDADDVLLHECGGEQLVEVKGQAFVDEAIVLKLRDAGLAGEVQRLTPVLPVLSTRTTTVPFTTCEEMLRYDGDCDTPLWKLAERKAGCGAGACACH